MKYLPHDDFARRKMLSAIGASEEALFSNLKKSPVKLFPALSESETIDLISDLQIPLQEMESAFGVGNYFIPPAVDYIASRGEFVTSYTPYQPECSQGTLAAIYEFQTRICELTGLDISNAGLYDGATAVVEAIRMSCAVTNRKEILVARTVAPHIRRTIMTYAEPIGVTVKEIAFDHKSGMTLKKIEELSDKTACVVISSPNVFGVIEEGIKDIFCAAQKNNSVAVQIFNPLAVSIFPTPFESGADIAVAEGQPLGIPLSGGGPFLGIISARNKFLRRMPGRIVGKTVDADGKTSFVLTLQTREQHIRREKATSNICSNQSLMALRAVLFLGIMGKTGLSELARNLKKKAEIESNGKRIFSGEIFNEYVVRGKDGFILDYPEFGEISLKGVAR